VDAKDASSHQIAECDYEMLKFLAETAKSGKVVLISFAEEIRQESEEGMIVVMSLQAMGPIRMSRISQVPGYHYVVWFDTDKEMQA